MNKKVLLLLVPVILIIFFGLFSALPSIKTVQQSNIRPVISQNDSSVARTAGKPADSRIKTPSAFNLSLFSTETPGARDLEFSPEGTLLVSLRKDGKLLALPDKDNDGQADEAKEVLTGLRNPHGLAFYNGKLFVAEETQINRYTWNEQTHTATLEKKLFDTPTGVTLPGGGGGHQTRSIVFDNSGNLYISVGSTCNVCEEKSPFLASVLITNENGDNPRVYASGLRNAVFLLYNSFTDAVWVTEMSRDRLGDNIPPDEINILQANAHYGWPYCYDDQVFDKDFGRKSAEFCPTTVKPTFKLQAHSAPLGLTFVPENTYLPEDMRGDLLVAYHGSWNRSVPTGYKVVRLNVRGNEITEEIDFITGFLQGNQAIGRPVDVIFDSRGNLYISDDKAGVIYVTNKSQERPVLPLDQPL